MPTQRKGETRQEFLARRKIYDRTYEKLSAKTPAGYHTQKSRKRTNTGKRIYTDEQRARINERRRQKASDIRQSKLADRTRFDADLRDFEIYRRYANKYLITPEVANWFRQGFHKTGKATDQDIRSRRLFLAWAYGHKHGRSTETRYVEDRANKLSQRQLETISGYDWAKWRADYAAYAAG